MTPSKIDQMNYYYYDYQGFWRTKNNMKRRQRGLAGGAIKREQTGESFWMMLPQSWGCCFWYAGKTFIGFFSPHIYSPIWILQVSCCSSEGFRQRRTVRKMYWAHPTFWLFFFILVGFNHSVLVLYLLNLHPSIFDLCHCPRFVFCFFVALFL